MTDTLGLENKDQFSTEILIHLIRKGWAATAGASADKVIAAIAGDTDKPSFDEARRLELTGSMKLEQRITFHLESGDPGMLDTALRDMVNAIAPGLCRLKGPFPLPTRVEQYTVLRDKTRVVHEVRTHKRVMMVDEPDKLFLSRTSQVMLQPGVGLKVRETKVAVGTFATFGELRADE